MKCPKCNGDLIVSDKGLLKCPTCDNVKRKLVLLPVKYNDFEFFKVLESANMNVEEYLFGNEVEEYIKQNIEISIKR